MEQWAVRFPAGARDLFLLHIVQTGSGYHPAFYLTHTRCYFPEDNVAGE
jgi:hypothetical protein